MGVATVFEVEVPASTLAFADTFERAPDVQFRVARTAGSAVSRPMPFVWVADVESDRASDLLAADSSVRGVNKLGEDGDAHLFEITFDGGLRTFVDAVFERNGVVVRATAADGIWTLQLRFDDRNDVGEVFDDAFRRKYEATVVRLYGSGDAPAGRVGVTDKQRRALQTAIEMGYYDIPRAVDLQEVGDRLDISRQAVSERLRRAHEVLVADFFGEGNERR